MQRKGALMRQTWQFIFMATTSKHNMKQKKAQEYPKFQVLSFNTIPFKHRNLISRNLVQMGVIPIIESFQQWWQNFKWSIWFVYLLSRCGQHIRQLLTRAPKTEPEDKTIFYDHQGTQTMANHKTHTSAQNRKSSANPYSQIQSIDSKSLSVLWIGLTPESLDFVCTCSRKQLLENPL